VQRLQVTSLATLIEQTISLPTSHAVFIYEHSRPQTFVFTQVYLSHGRVLKPTFSSKSSRQLLAAPPPALMRHLTAAPPPSASAAAQNFTGSASRQRQQQPSMQWDVKGEGAPAGATTLVQRAKQQRCMYWVGPRYQTCLDGVTEVTRVDNTRHINVHVFGSQVYRQDQYAFFRVFSLHNRTLAQKVKTTF